MSDALGTVESILPPIVQALSPLVAQLASLLHEATTAKQEQHADIMARAAQALTDFDAATAGLLASLAAHDAAADAALSGSPPPSGTASAVAPPPDEPKP